MGNYTATDICMAGQRPENKRKILSDCCFHVRVNQYHKISHIKM